MRLILKSSFLAFSIDKSSNFFYSIPGQIYTQSFETKSDNYN
jgi:hypothetical protein